MKIGYACLTIGVKNSDFKSVTKKNASNERLREVIRHNLTTLKNIIIYNVENNIRMYRITSDLIPFGNSNINKIKWFNEFKKEFDEIASIINKNKMRVSMHPGQYSVLNSMRREVVNNTVKDLEYHNLILDLLDTNYEAKIILHIGGVYDDKEESIKRFITEYKKLSQKVKNRLIIENDDKLYNIEDVLYISSKANIPVVYDNLHNEVNPSSKGIVDDNFWIKKAIKTWPKDQKPKVHYSQQNPRKNKGAHTKTINHNVFLKYIKSLEEDVDVMLEVKDKNVSCIKCMNILDNKNEVQKIEKEWAKYKYYILERNHGKYLEIREMLNDKKEINSNSFYSLIEEEIDKEVESLNAIEHVWGYFKNIASDREKSFFIGRKADFKKEKEKTIISLKKFLFKLAKKYDNNYLLSSYFFEL